MSRKLRIQKLKDLAYSWQGVLEKILNEKHDRSLFLQYAGNEKDRDRYLLLSLRTWSLKYKLSVEEILEVLLEFWTRFEKRYRRLPKGRKGVGVRISSFCSDRSEKIITDYIRKKYKANEHISAWKAAEQQKQLRKAQIKKMSCQSVTGFIKKYKKQVETARKKIQKSLSRPRRNYPGNPWQ